MKNNIKILILLGLFLIDAAQSKASVKPLQGERQNNWNADSTAFIPYDSVSYDYDGGGKVMLQHNLTYDATTGWKETSNIVYTYTNELLSNKTTYSLSTGTPVNSYKVDYTYNGNNLLATEQNFLWISGVWRGVYSYTSTYDAQQRLVSYTTANWNNATSSFRNYRRTQYGNFIGNNATTVIMQVWDATTGFWKDNTKNERQFYSSTLKDSLVLQFTWVDSISQWRVRYGTSYTYNTDTNVTSVSYFQFVSLPFVGLSAYPLTKTTCDYTNGMLTYQLNLRYTGSTYQPQSNVTFTLDANNHYTSTLSKTYDTISSTFVNSAQSLLEYDIDGDLLHEMDKTWESGHWTFLRENYYWYRATILGIAAVETVKSLIAFPNPCNVALNLELDLEKSAEALIQLIDLSGRVATEQNVRLNEGVNRLQIATGELPSGFFFVKIKAGSEIFVQKVLKM
jgi:hypothetical protein